MTYQFKSPGFNPRPSLSDDWVALARSEALADAPGFAREFILALDQALPDVSAGLQFLRHPNHDDLFAILEDDSRGIAIQFDIYLEYIVIYSLVRKAHGGEHGDCGDGLDSQVQSALSSLQFLIAAS